MMLNKAVMVEVPLARGVVAEGDGEAVEAAAKACEVLVRCIRRVRARDGVTGQKRLCFDVQHADEPTGVSSDGWAGSCGIRELPEQEEHGATVGCGYAAARQGGKGQR